MMARRIVCAVFALLLAVTACAEPVCSPTPVPAPPGAQQKELRRAPWSMPTVEPLETQEPGLLTGYVIGIDPGHQARGNSEKEAVAPGSSEMKAKVTSGTAGVSTRVAEHVVNLDVAIKLRDAFRALGAEVHMTRETADVDISNQERAIMLNEYDCDLVLRIHCNGSANSSARGIGTYVRATGDRAEECALAAEYILDAMCEATGAERDGVFKRDTYTGLNWSEVPCVLIEMGFMSNPEEDQLLNDAEYQEKLVTGMVDGTIGYLLHGDEEISG